MWHADYNDNFFIQRRFFNIQSLKSSVTEQKVCEWFVDGAFNVPSFEFILWSQIKDNDAVWFVLEQRNEIFGANSRWNFTLNVTQLNTVDVLKIKSN